MPFINEGAEGAMGIMTAANMRQQVQQMNRPGGGGSGLPLEGVPKFLYDTVKVPAVTGTSSIRFFTDVANKSRWETNLNQSGILSTPNHLGWTDLYFRVYDAAVGPWITPAGADVLKALRPAYLEFKIEDKTYLEVSNLESFGAGNYAIDTTVAGVSAYPGWPSVNNVLKFKRPLVLLPTVNFRFEVTYFFGAFIPSAAVYVQLILKGHALRATQ